MKVKELINILERYNPDNTVAVIFSIKEKTIQNNIEYVRIRDSEFDPNEEIIAIDCRKY